MLTLDAIRIPMDRGALTASFTIEQTARVAVLGPSGAGKSTLLDAIAGFRDHTSGHMSFAGQRMSDLPPQERPISILFQDGNLFPHLTLERNLGLALAPNGRRPNPQEKARIQDALTRVELQDMQDRKPGSLSGGQQGRAGLARVLLQARPMILLDEPFAALGPALKAEMLEEVRRVADSLNALVMMVTHDPNDAKRFADQVILVADGVAHAPVATADFFDTPPEAFRAYIGS